MSRPGGAEHPSARTRQEAATWFGRMRGANADRMHAEFEAWRSADPSHAAAYAEVEALWRRSGALADTQVGRNRQLPRRPKPLLQLRFARPALATLAVAAAIGLAFALLGASSFRPSTMIAASAAPLISKVGEIRTVKLEDGSRVTLDTDSAIEVTMTPAARKVRLTRGRARFDVAPERARPFRVQAGGRTVTAVGSLFDVELDREGVRVAAVRGVAEVAGAAPAGGQAVSTRLKAGECLFDLGGVVQVVPSPSGADRWPSGMLSFDAVPLEQVITQTNRYSARKLVLAAPALGSLRVTGAFRPVPVDALATSLAAAFGLRVERLRNGDLALDK